MILVNVKKKWNPRIFRLIFELCGHDYNSAVSVHVKLELKMVWIQWTTMEIPLIEGCFTWTQFLFRVQRNLSSEKCQIGSATTFVFPRTAVQLSRPRPKFRSQRYLRFRGWVVWSPVLRGRIPFFVVSSTHSATALLFPLSVNLYLWNTVNFSSVFLCWFFHNQH